VITISTWKETCSHLSVAAVTEEIMYQGLFYGCLKRQRISFPVNH